MSILGDIEDGIKLVESKIKPVEHFLVEEFVSTEHKIHVELSHVEATFDKWYEATIVPAFQVTEEEIKVMRGKFLSFLKGL